MRSLENTDATFDTCMPFTTCHKPFQLASTNDVGMGFENAQHFLLSWHALLLQAPALGLIHHFLGQRHKGLQGSFQAFGGFPNWLPKLLTGSGSLLEGVLGHVQQGLVLLLTGFLGFIGAFAQDFANLASGMTGRPGEIFLSIVNVPQCTFRTRNELMFYKIYEEPSPILMIGIAEKKLKWKPILF